MDGAIQWCFKTVFHMLLHVRRLPNFGVGSFFFRTISLSLRGDLYVFAGLQLWSLHFLC